MQAHRTLLTDTCTRHTPHHTPPVGAPHSVAHAHHLTPTCCRWSVVHQFRTLLTATNAKSAPCPHSSPPPPALRAACACSTQCVHAACRVLQQDRQGTLNTCTTISSACADTTHVSSGQQKQQTQACSAYKYMVRPDQCQQWHGQHVQKQQTQQVHGEAHAHAHIHTHTHTHTCTHAHMHTCTHAHMHTYTHTHTHTHTCTHTHMHTHTHTHTPTHPHTHTHTHTHTHAHMHTYRA